MTNIENVPLEQLTASDFRVYLESDFYARITGVDEPLTLCLIEVMDLNEGGPRREPFSLIFRGPKGAYLPQQIYTLTHDVMGALDIFLVPIRPDERGARLQAIFN